jgi:hypothetical protein
MGMMSDPNMMNMMFNPYMMDPNILMAMQQYQMGGIFIIII